MLPFVEERIGKEYMHLGNNYSILISKKCNNFLYHFHLDYLIQEVACRKIFTIIIRKHLKITIIRKKTCIGLMQQLFWSCDEVDYAWYKQITFFYQRKQFINPHKKIVNSPMWEPKIKKRVKNKNFEILFGMTREK